MTNERGSRQKDIALYRLALAIKKPPCEDRGGGLCQHYQLCKEQQLACPAFQWYCGCMAGKTLRKISQTARYIPSKGAYQHVFSD